MDRKEQLNSAEERRRRLREKIEQQERNLELNVKSPGQVYKEKRERERLEEKKRKEELAEKQQIQDEKLAMADKAMKEAAIFIKSKKFDEAKNAYKRAIELFRDLEWTDQIEQLNKEIQNVDKYKTDFLKRQEAIAQKEREKDKEFNQKVNRLLEEKKKREAVELEIQQRLPQELQMKLNRAELLIKKAEKEETLGRNDRALKRYQLIMEIYDAFPNDQVDLSERMTEIKRKIFQLKAKK